MIVKVLPARPAGTGRRLGTYILSAKHEHDGERLGAYIADPDKKEKVLDSRTVNAGVDDPMQAIGAIELYNAQNTRWHKISRFEHIVVSFSRDERPTREQLDVIEDRLMASIGFGDHPRISAVHSNSRDSLTDGYVHKHICVSRIDPTTLKAEHPRRSHLLLQAEAARLEIDLGLRQERKTLLARERREIDARAALDRSHNRHHTVDGEKMPEDPFKQWEDEQREANQARLDHPHPNDAIERRAELRDSGLEPNQIDRAVRRGYRESRSARPYHEHPLTPERIDRELDLAAKGYFNALGRGGSESLPPMEAASRSFALDRQQSRVGQKATPKQALEARFKTEKTIAMGALKEAEQRIYDRWGAYQKDLGGFYDLRREQEKLNARQPSRVDRTNAHELLHAQQHGDRVAANQTRAMQLAKVRRDHPLPSWESFLERESNRGDKEATRLVQKQRRAREMDRGNER